MITVVDRNSTHEVQKITNPQGKVIRYQVADGSGDSSKVTVCSTLTEARALIGKDNGGKPLPSFITNPSAASVNAAKPALHLSA